MSHDLHTLFSDLVPGVARGVGVDTEAGGGGGGGGETWANG